MKRFWSLVLLSLTAVALVLAPRSARAADDEAAKLEALGKALAYTLKTTGPASPIDTGGAAILVNAPIEEVRQVVVNYGNYQKFLKPFDQSKVLSKTKGVSEIYLQVPILHGAMHLWTVADMSPPTKKGAEEVIVGRFKRGNIADFRAAWRMRAVDNDHTVLKLEVFLDPNLPLPSSIVTNQLRLAAEKGVVGVKERAQTAAAAKRTTSAASKIPVAGGDKVSENAPEKAGNAPPSEEIAQQAAPPKAATDGPPASAPAPLPLPLPLPVKGEGEGEVSAATRQKDVARR